jgi:5-methylcytosine-specific restriction endonuclease McrA
MSGGRIVMHRACLAGCSMHPPVMCQCGRAAQYKGGAPRGFRRLVSGPVLPMCDSCYQRSRYGWHPFASVVCSGCGAEARVKSGNSLCRRCRAADRAALRRQPDPVCLACGATFKRKSGSDKFCCVEHRQMVRKRTSDQNHAKNHKRRAAKYGAGYECFPDSDIYQRDGWRCGICTKRVRPSRFKRDPEGPSLDHIIPLALGGTHSRANVRLTHLRCNNARGVRGDVQLLLLG